jgi:parallel beta-helix repeat protein
MNHLDKTLLRLGLLAVMVAGGTPGWAAQPIQPTCGETIASGNWVLTANVGPCSDGAPALTVEGPAHLDMDGYMVLCEADGGDVPTGIQVTGQNARISDGTVKGCNTGIAVEGDGHHRLEGITVVGSQDRGINIGSDGNRLEWVTVLGSGDEGMRIEGDGNRVVEGRAAGNHNHGIRVKNASNNSILSTQAFTNLGEEIENGTVVNVFGEGIRLEGDHNVAKDCIANGNGDEGVRVKGGEGNVVSHCLAQANGTTTGEPGIEVDEGATHTVVEYTRASANAADGIASGGQYTLVRHDTTLANGSVVPQPPPDDGGAVVPPGPFGAGIRVRAGGTDNRLTRNTAHGNRVTDLVDENENCDNNAWRRNSFDTADPADSCIR